MIADHIHGFHIRESKDQEVCWAPGVAISVQHCVMHHTCDLDFPSVFYILDKSQSQLQNIYMTIP
jgi:hypothetical protein